ncbi:RNA polymerase sigma factor [Chondrinema litorale]|uniref:RNA polymerase sigma factor n=1 Tax=Chondrinema litorale TaxID=2994555 RepID=UPI0025434E86|nr:sigma-70 family RNA polymerase sigma factor [Chondrinema litorale]UZR99332.1 sigma-70 family RNA polymerase sigma factor [Chondrinema litorale]
MSNDKQHIDSLIEKIALKRDKKSFESFFNIFYVELHAIALHIVESDQFAREAVNEVMLKIWEGKKEIFNITDVKAYLRKAVRNQAIDIQRKNKKHTININLSTVSEKDNPLAENPEDVYLYQEMHNSLNALIEKMPEKRRAVFYLVKFSGKKYKEVAKILNISEKTVEKHMREGFKFLIDNNCDFFNKPPKKNSIKNKSLIISIIVLVHQVFLYLFSK